jgi:hypothetical protein
MTLVALVSAKGAPGVTTLALTLGALAGPDAVVADLDPAGGDLALRYRTPEGDPLDPDCGLLSLAATLRGTTGLPVVEAGTGGPDAPVPSPLAPYTQELAGGLAVLTGVRRPEQMSGLAPLWPQIIRALRSAPGLVVADCGRVWPGSPVLPVLQAADAVLVPARAELEDLAHLRERLPMLTAALPPAPATGGRLGVVLLAGERERAAAVTRTRQLLRAAGLRVPVVGSVADDPRGADVLRGMRHGRPGRTLLVRSARTLLPSVLALAERLAVREEQAREADERGAASRPVAPTGSRSARPEWAR